MSLEPWDDRDVNGGPPKLGVDFGQVINDAVGVGYQMKGNTTLERLIIETERIVYR